MLLSLLSSYLQQLPFLLPWMLLSHVTVLTEALTVGRWRPFLPSTVRSVPALCCFSYLLSFPRCHLFVSGMVVFVNFFLPLLFSSMAPVGSTGCMTFCREPQEVLQLARWNCLSSLPLLVTFSEGYQDCFLSDSLLADEPLVTGWEVVSEL